jgi:mRNA-degrading endonuclease RelE of RelBE toxin-antitoxin system
MSYTLVYTSRAEKDINKLDSPIKGRLGRSILRLQKNPIQLSEKLTDPKI